jgi:predicted nucleotidyltransferase
MTEPLGLESLHSKLIEKIIRDFLSGKQTWQVDVFGSRRRGDHRTYSDLDLWIEATPALSLRDAQKLIDAFEESDLPIKVDIVTPDSVVEEYRPNIMYEKKTWLKSSGS